MRFLVLLTLQRSYARIEAETKELNINHTSKEFIMKDFGLILLIGRDPVVTDLRGSDWIEFYNQSVNTVLLVPRLDKSFPLIPFRSSFEVEKIEKSARKLEEQFDRDGIGVSRYGLSDRCMEVIANSPVQEFSGPGLLEALLYEKKGRWSFLRCLDEIEKVEKKRLRWAVADPCDECQGLSTSETLISANILRRDGTLILDRKEGLPEGGHTSEEEKYWSGRQEIPIFESGCSGNLVVRRYESLVVIAGSESRHAHLLV